MAVTPHGVLPRDYHEIPPTLGGGTQVADFTKGFSKEKITKSIRRRNGGVRGPGTLCCPGLSLAFSMASLCFPLQNLIKSMPWPMFTDFLLYCLGCVDLLQKSEEVPKS